MVVSREERHILYSGSIRILFPYSLLATIKARGKGVWISVQGVGCTVFGCMFQGIAFGS